jgi:hypothetical protein
MTVKQQTKIAIFAGFILAAMLPVAGIGCAYADDIVRVRGTIESVDGSTYTVKTRDGAEQKITLAPNAQVAGLVKASLADIKSGSFVGVTALPSRTARSARLRFTYSRNRCAAPARDITLGIFSRTAQ